MIVTSSTQTQYTQATNKTTATKATSSYESTTAPTQTQQADPIAEIQKKEEPTKETTEVQNETQKPIITTQQEIEIKQQAAQTVSETEESPLATAIQESSQTQSAKQSQATGRMAEMQEKYKDVYTPIPETYSKADEELQKQKIYEAYPNYIDLTDILKKHNEFYKGEPIRLGQSNTKEQEEQQKIAGDKVTAWIIEQVGSLEALGEMTKGAYEIMKKYPVNQIAKDGDVKNAAEITRFYNAAVYEGLESGKTIDDAKKDAYTAREAFMDMSAAHRKTDPMFNPSKLKGTHSLYENGKSFLQIGQEEREVNWDAKWRWDLREYGIEGEWQWYDIYENQKQMIDEIKKEIDQYNFMLDNRAIIEKANEQLAPDERNQINDYEKYIQDFMPVAELGLKVFEKYEIYDN